MSASVFRCCTVKIVSNEMTSPFIEFCYLSDSEQACISICPKKRGHSDNHIYGTFPHLVTKRITKSYWNLPAMCSNHFYATLCLRTNLGASISHSRDISLSPPLHTHTLKICGDFTTEIIALRRATGKARFESRQKQQFISSQNFQTGCMTHLASYSIGKGPHPRG